MNSVYREAFIMNKKGWKKYVGIVCAASILSWAPAFTAVNAYAQVPTITHSMQYQPSWESNVNKGINDFIAMYGNKSPDYANTVKPYAVFDFDNTTAILDIEEQLAIWQLDRLAFAISPDNMKNVLLTGIPKDKLNAVYGADDGSGKEVKILDAITDAANDYKVLYKKGWVTTKGMQPTAEMKASPEYQDFKAKMRWLYTAIGDTMDSSVSYPWVTYWFTGMTPSEVYNLAKESHLYYGDKTKGQTWTKGSYTSPNNLSTKAGPVTISYKNGITVTPQMLELYRSLNANGIDTWVNSASQVDVVKAAVDAFNIPGVDGVVAMTNKLDKSGRYINEYNYDLHDQTQGKGKSTTINKVIAPLYQGHGPALAAMDSQGDFNFATEFKDTKIVLIFNRQRKDDAAIVAGIAEYQKKHHIDLAAANKNGDSLFLLQGRNENNGTYWDSDQTLLLGKKDTAYLSPKALKVEHELNLGKSISDVIQDNKKDKEHTGYKTR